jgi:hypothetical protein
MNHLDQIENRIKEIIEKGGDLLPWSDKNAILVSHFCETLRLFLNENPSILADTPTEFRVFMSPEEVKMWKEQPCWQKMLTDAFVETTVELNCRPLLMPELTLACRNSLQSGEILFAIESLQNEQEKTGVVNISKPMKTSKRIAKSPSEYILLNLDQSIPLDKPVTNLGRKSNNDIVIDDMRVSRLHAQIRRTREGYMVFDVGSTGGTFVNNERITSKLLKSGDVISLAGFTLIFTNEKESLPESEREITSDLNKDCSESAS